MNCTIHCNKVVVGGLIAGVWMNFCDFIAHGVVLMQRYQNLAKMGHYFSEPTLPFMPLNTLLNFCLGALMVWLYAISRDTLGPGAKAAFKVGFAVAVIAALPMALSAVAWSPIGKCVPFVNTVNIFSKLVLGTMIGAYFYKPKTSIG